MNSIEELNHELEEHIEHITEDVNIKFVIKCKFKMIQVFIWKETDQYDSGKINDIESLKVSLIYKLEFLFFWSFSF